MINITMLCANRPRLLKQALDSIGNLSNATVTIRDAGMNRQTRLVVHDWVLSHPGGSSSYLDSAPLGTGPARNQVVRTSESLYGRGDYLYLSDDDVCWTRPDWLAILVEAYQLSRPYGYRAIGAYNHPYNQPCEISFVRCEDPYNVWPVWALASQSMLMDWETWDTFGPFCDTPAGKVCQSEDVAFSNKIREAGFKVGVISPSLLVNTGITNSFGEHIPGWELVKSQAPEGIIVE